MAKKRKTGGVKVKSPGGLSMSALHALVKKSQARDAVTGKQHNKLREPQNRWQRTARYGWDKNRGRG